MTIFQFDFANHEWLEKHPETYTMTGCCLRDGRIGVCRQLKLRHKGLVLLHEVLHYLIPWDAKYWHNIIDRYLTVKTHYLSGKSS